MSNRVILAAEIGSNYNGDLALAKAYIRKSAASGADLVKFQTLTKATLIAPKVRTEAGLVANPVWDIFKNHELPAAWHAELAREAREHGVGFFSTPFSLEAVDILEASEVELYKIASGDITFLPLLRRVGATGKRVILSTGASTLDEVDKAVETLAAAGAGPITLLHCVVSYPPAWEEINLRVLTTLRERFGLPVGISDHSPGAVVPLASVALGACFIEKHVTFHNDLPGPDHPFAMPFEAFAAMARDVRCLEAALGTGEKVPTASERERLRRFRRGVYDPATGEPVAGEEGVWLRPQHDGPGGPR